MEQKRHPIWFTLVVGVPAIAVSSCTKTLDTSKVESDIQQAIVRQGGSSLKTAPKILILQRVKRLTVWEPSILVRY